MKKSTKIFLRIMPVVAVAVMMGGSVFGINVIDPTAGTGSTAVADVAGKIWGTVVPLIQILAIAAIVIAGVRYMFASADTKADIKTQTVTLIAGAILVFAAVPIAKFVSSVASQILQ